MSFENRHIFRGVLNGKSLSDYTKLDYNVRGLESRKAIVENLMDQGIDEHGRNYFETYFDEYFKVELNQADELSEKNNVCKTLENLANYLLGSEEVREERKSDKQQYRFYINQEEFNLRTKKEDFLDGMVPEDQSGNSNNNSHDGVMHFLLNNSKNNKKCKIQAISQKDLKEDNYCGSVLRNYNVMYESITNELLNSKQFNGRRYKLTKIKKDLFFDMIYCKDHLNGVFGYKPRNLLSDSCSPSWEAFDWTNTAHIKELIYLQAEFNPEKELSFLIIDLDDLSKRMFKDGVFTPMQLKAYKLIRQGYKNTEICEIMQIHKSSLSRLVTTIVEKICEAARIYKFE